VITRAFSVLKIDKRSPPWRPELGISIRLAASFCSPQLLTFNTRPDM
jgi:hypothetical protein